ncbi:MAG: CAP domain-containing protein [Clostridiales bacterium]|nr:CAP domain-containing protein [Clostridiales bacterium]
MDTINEFRHEHDSPPLVHDPTLSEASRYRTEYFRRFPEVSVYHTTGTLDTEWVMVLGASGGAVSDWMRSRTGHRESLLHPQSTRIGVGVSSRAKYIFVGSH